jgi:hypothetical protein
MRKKGKEKTECEILRMGLTELQPASYNPRKISIEAFQGLGKSIEKFGLLIPIVWNKRTGNVVGGHQRLRYLTEIGETETDVVVVDLDDNEEVALNISLNNKALRGEFTKDVVELLERTEYQIGSAFDEVMLSDLFKDMEKKFEKELKEKTEKPLREKKEFSGDGSGGGSGGEFVDSAETLVTCPECHSRWKMKNNEVVFDSRTAEN